MKQYRERLNDLEKEVISEINFIRENNPPFIFLTDEDIEEEADLGHYFEVRSNMTGEVFDAHLISVSNQDIKIVESWDRSKRHTIQVKDFVSILDRINLLEKIR